MDWKKLGLYSVILLALLGYVVYNYGRLVSMSGREYDVYLAILAFIAILILMLFSEKITIGNFLTIVPHIWRKTEQNGREIAEVKEIAVEALEIATEAKEIAESNNRVATDEEVIEMFERIFGKNTK